MIAGSDAMRVLMNRLKSLTGLLLLALMLGLYIPPYLNGWYVQAAAMLGG
jgi:hydrogenase-4 component F